MTQSHHDGVGSLFRHNPASMHLDSTGEKDSRPLSRQPWAISLPPTDTAGAALLRLIPGVRVCQQPDALWLRGPDADDALDLLLRSIPGAQRFRVLADGQLQAPGHHVPKGRLPVGDWQPLIQWLEVEPPPPHLAGQARESVPLKMVRSTLFAEPDLLLVDLAAWTDYATSASQIRLARWLFAAAADRRVVVRGRPLPSLPGQCFVLREGVATPAGWTWSPPVDPSIVRSVLGLAAADVALWHSDGTWELLPGDEFVQASRAAARNTAEACRDG